MAKKKMYGRGINLFLPGERVRGKRDGRYVYGRVAESWESLLGLRLGGQEKKYEMSLGHPHDPAIVPWIDDDGRARWEHHSYLAKAVLTQLFLFPMPIPKEKRSDP